MGMVTLVQQHQETAPDENRYQKEQDQVINIPSEDRDSDDCREEIAHPLKDTAVVVAGNGSLAGSSTQCSDVEEEDEDDDETDTDEEEWIPDLPVPTVYQQHQQVSTADGNVVLPNAEASNFGDVRVKNSSNVHLGNKTFYKGPVTIKQFVYTNPVSVQENGNVKDDNEQAHDANGSTSSAAKEDSTANSSILSQSRNIDKGDDSKK